ncbi:MAG: hypothetical protein ACUVWP_02500 [bacterium]
MVSELKGFRDYLERFANENGATLFGVADLQNIQEENKPLPPIFDNLTRVISIAIRLSSEVLLTIIDSPTKLYTHHYKQVNYLLDNIALKITGIIQYWGYKALPIPASQITDWNRISSEVSHRKIAHLAGLGFIGRNHLLVTDKYGAQVRLVSVATNCPLPPNAPAIGDCSQCFACIEICPAKAINRDPLEFNLDRCKEMLKIFAKKGIGQYICGICVKACKGKNIHNEKVLK